MRRSAVDGTPLSKGQEEETAELNSKRRPNILLIQADQLRYDSLGCTGNPYAVTPHIDAFASTATVFHRHIAASPVCMPSRASLLTGRYPSGHGLWHNGVALPRETHVHYDPVASGVSERSHERQVISHVPTLPDALSAAGYETRAIGKLHLTPTGSDPYYQYEESRTRWKRGELDDWHGPYYGFEYVDLTIGHGEATIGHYRRWQEETHPDVAKALDSGRHRCNPEFPELPQLYPSAIPVSAHHSTWIADRATAFLEERGGRDDPFFLYLGFPDPHHPFSPPAGLAEEFSTHQTMPPVWSPEEGRSKPSAIARSIEDPEGPLSARGLPADAITRMRQYTDAMIHLIDRSVGRILDTLDRLGLTDDTIVIFTSDHGDFLGDHQLMLKDTLCSSALVHVPFIMRAPGARLPPATTVPMSNVDVLPTLCDLSGTPIPADVQGSSILDAIAAGTPRFVQVYGYQHEALNHNFSVFDEQYRFTWYPNTDERELYEHPSDPHELRNLAGEPSHAGTEERLAHALLRRHLRSDNPAGGRIARF